MLTPAPTLPEVAPMAPPIMRALVLEEAVTLASPPRRAMFAPSSMAACVMLSAKSIATEPATAAVVFSPVVMAPAMDSA